MRILIVLGVSSAVVPAMSMAGTGAVGMSLGGVGTTRRVVAKQLKQGVAPGRVTVPPGGQKSLPPMAASVLPAAGVGRVGSVQQVISSEGSAAHPGYLSLALPPSTAEPGVMSGQAKKTQLFIQNPKLLPHSFKEIEAEGLAVVTQLQRIMQLNHEELKKLGGVTAGDYNKITESVYALEQVLVEAKKNPKNQELAAIMSASSVWMSALESVIQLRAKVAAVVQAPPDIETGKKEIKVLASQVADWSQSIQKRQVEQSDVYKFYLAYEKVKLQKLSDSAELAQDVVAINTAKMHSMMLLQNRIRSLAEQSAGVPVSLQVVPHPPMSMHDEILAPRPASEVQPVDRGFKGARLGVIEPPVPGVVEAHFPKVTLSIINEGLWSSSQEAEKLVQAKLEGQMVLAKFKEEPFEGLFEKDRIALETIISGLEIQLMHEERLFPPREDVVASFKDVLRAWKMALDEALQLKSKTAAIMQPSGDHGTLKSFAEQAKVLTSKNFSSPMEWGKVHEIYLLHAKAQLLVSSSADSLNDESKGYLATIENAKKIAMVLMESRMRLDAEEQVKKSVSNVVGLSQAMRRVSSESSCLLVYRLSMPE